MNLKYFIGGMGGGRHNGEKLFSLATAQAKIKKKVNCMHEKCTKIQVNILKEEW